MGARRARSHRWRARGSTTSVAAVVVAMAGIVASGAPAAPAPEASATGASGAPASPASGASGAPAATGAPGAPCAPLDIALVLDTSTSMDPAIDEVKAQIAQLTSTVETASGGDYRIGLVDFGADVTVHVPFAARNAAAVREALPGLRQANNNSGNPEAWDEALATVVENRSAADIPAAGGGDHQTGDFGMAWRPDAKKIVVLVTDARPSGFDDDYDTADLAHARDVATRAAAAGMRVATVFVPNGNQEDDAQPMLQQVAGLTGARFFSTAPDGTNLIEGVDLAVETCATDTDGDALFDTWETDGYDADGDGTIDLDLAALGADPEHKDLFLQVNWMKANPRPQPCQVPVFCRGADDGEHAPDPAALERVARMFAEAPVANPDGETGITVHYDAGTATPKGLGTGGDDEAGGVVDLHENAVVDDCGPDDIAGRPDYDHVADIRDDHVSAARAAVFTWIFYVHRVDAKPVDETCLGRALGIPSDSVLIAQTLTSSTKLEASTLAHELGHTLGLRHGGYDDIPGKPNYLSVMNADFALHDGIPVEGEGTILDYSRFQLLPLDESALDETAGIGVRVPGQYPEGYSTWYGCRTTHPEESGRRRVSLGGPIDWSCSGPPVDGTAVSQVLHGVYSTNDAPTVLESRDDWSTITFAGGVRGGLETASEPVDETGLTFEAWRTTPKDHAITFTGPGAVSAEPGSPLLRLPFRLENLGTEDDTYTLTASVAGDWEGTAAVAGPPEEAGSSTEPSTGTGTGDVELAAGSRSDVAVYTAIPAGAARGDEVEVTVTVRSSGDESVTATASAGVVAGESEPLQPDGHLTVIPAQPEAGDRFTVTGDGFAPDSDVAVTADEDWFAPVVADADRNGAISVELTAPDRAGRATISAVGLAPDSKPPGPAEPADPTDPANPADPADPTDPADPANPAEPSDPADPTDLADPVDPADPAVTGSTTAPTAPELSPTPRLLDAEVQVVGAAGPTPASSGTWRLLALVAAPVIVLAVATLLVLRRRRTPAQP